MMRRSSASWFGRPSAWLRSRRCHAHRLRIAYCCVTQWLIGYRARVLPIVALLSFALPGGAGGSGVATAAEPEMALRFDRDILPVLTKHGCNAGACHGAAAGRGGLHLSLLGSDPAADFEEIAFEFEGRRIDRQLPTESLLLKKPTEQLAHGGQLVFDADSDAAILLGHWISQGALRGRPTQLVSLQVEPTKSTAARAPADFQLRAMARFDDDDQPRDVTGWTIFAADDPSSVHVDRSAMVTVQRPGRHVVTARFLNRVVPVIFIVAASESQSQSQGSAPLAANFIDQHINQRLVELNCQATPPAAEATWLRRVTLDLTGKLPTLAEIEQLQNDRSPSRKQNVVARLISSRAFTDYWTARLAGWLQVHALPGEGEDASFACYVQWLRACVDEDKPLDLVAEQLLLASGDSREVGPANFARMANDPRAHAELVGRVFLGVSMGCANCHDHPLDKWTQDDFHGLATILSRVDRGRVVRVLERGEVTNPRTGQPAVPRVPGVRYLPIDEDGRSHLARWILDAETRLFARCTVNRLWHSMFGRGLVDPVDDMRDTNPATHPELLEALAQDFTSHGSSLRRTLTMIALSEAYGRQSSPAADALPAGSYAAFTRRPLTPEMLVDAIASVTDVTEEFRLSAAEMRLMTTSTPAASMIAGTPAAADALATNLIDPAATSASLKALGRCPQTRQACNDSASATATLAAQLHLINGQLVNARLQQSHGRLQQLIVSGSTDQQIIEEFTLRALGRMPTMDESQRWRQLVRSEDPLERQQRLEDFLWALLASRDFQENH